MNLILSLVLIHFLNAHYHSNPDWGFYAHKLINRKAVFTLPQDMLPFYKQNINYLTEHAVDPDKRRYALKNEYTRHYIDIDHWDTIPFPNVPRKLKEACLKYGQFLGISDNDTIILALDSLTQDMLYSEFIFQDRYAAELKISRSEFQNLIRNPEWASIHTVLFDNQLIQYGSLPYFLVDFQRRLTRAMMSGDKSAVLKISADIGHYIADAHVPLHTTMNYNGQLTNQTGLHAFWESRLPELYAENEYDFFAGRAVYIENLSDYFWDIIIQSHNLLNTVLENELTLRQQFPESLQMCFDRRGEQNVLTQCREFAEAYHNSMGGMVENRMRDAILAIGSVWYTCWVDAGQPDMINWERPAMVDSLSFKSQADLEKAFNNNKINGRQHAN